ncbi:MAG: NTP transferase domain-containing protein [Propionibacteriaceae bacterium]|nr:NTP transferase domain-containing protein [Propionibacteriaceae bacterium]
MDIARTDLTTAVIMARGLGTRMRKDAAGVELDATQSTMADRGMKGMIDVGRPFLDHVISAAADAGITDVILVIGPEHDEIRRYYDELPRSRTTVDFAVQQPPQGTADALVAAPAAVGDRRFLLMNSDNYYPTDALRALRAVEGHGLVGFDPRGLVEHGNIPAERVRAFALIESRAGRLVRIVEKPDEATLARMGAARVSMNCFAFDPAIFDHAAAVQPSPRGEYELTDAVRAALAAGEPFTVVESDAGVLDLSERADVARVGAALAGREAVL